MPRLWGECVCVEVELLQVRRDQGLERFRLEVWLMRRSASSCLSISVFPAPSPRFMKAVVLAFVVGLMNLCFECWQSPDRTGRRRCTCWRDQGTVSLVAWCVLLAPTKDIFWDTLCGTACCVTDIR